MDRQGNGREILLRLSFEDVRSRVVQHVAEPVIDLGEEDGLIDPCGVLEGDELHGIAVLRLHRLAGDQPSRHGDIFAHVEMKIAGLHVMQSSQCISVTVQRMDGKVEAEGVEFMLEHEGF